MRAIRKPRSIDRSKRILVIGPYEAVVLALTLLQDGQSMQMAAVPFEGSHHAREEAFRAYTSLCSIPIPIKRSW